MKYAFYIDVVTVEAESEEAAWKLLREELRKMGEDPDPTLYADIEEVEEEE